VLFYWGEQITPTGERFDIQLKGAGRTNYSRNGDGLATFYSMLREFIMSEAMHYLGIPTTRSLAVVKNGLSVYRESEHEGAVLTRVAASHIRCGTFEYVRQFGSPHELEKLTNYVIQRHFPEILNQKNQALELLRVVMLKQLDLVVEWMRVGFIHGVMNTDNMSIAGETIDYGPCAFMNNYNPKTVYSSIDRSGRYAFGQQPNIAWWNVSVLAGTLLPLIHSNEQTAVHEANELLQTYKRAYEKKWFNMICNKIGILQPKESDRTLVENLMTLLNRYQPDYTSFFIQLEQFEPSKDKLFLSSEFIEWYKPWKERIRTGQTIEDALGLMQANNPSVIPRNHLVEEALNSAVVGNTDGFNALLEQLKQPYKRDKVLLANQEVPDGFDQSYQTFCGT